MKIKKAYLLKVNGTITRQPQMEGKELDLQDCYKAIDCTTIEHVGLKKGVDLWIDENGLLRSAMFNPMATKFYRAAYPHVPAEQIGIVGDCILTDNTKLGEFISNN